MLRVVLFCVAFLAFQCNALKNPMEDLSLFEGDMVLEPDQVLDIENGGVNPNIPLAATRSFHWPKVIPYAYRDDIKSSDYAVKVIQAAIADYERFTCLKFVQRTNETEYLYFYRGRGCSSHVGHYKGRVNWVSLAGGCWTKGIVMHEIAHSLGFYHEQSRPDRDHYVQIIWDNIPDSVEYNFRKHGSNIDSMNVPYDYRSVMHYGRTAFGSGKTTIQTIDKSKQYVIGQRGGFSELDKLQMNLLYKCPGFTKPPPGTLPPIPTTKPATIPPDGNAFIARHYGGLCMSVGSDNRLQLTTTCDQLFSFTSSKALIHLKSKKCVVPKGLGDNSDFVTDFCQLTDDQYKQTSRSSIQHIGSGKCFHPLGGSSTPKPDTKLVIYSGCDQSRLSFKFEYVKVTTAAPVITTVPPSSGQFLIKHYNGLCMAYDYSAKRLYLTSACNEKFELTASKSLKHINTGKCVAPEGTYSNSRVTLISDCSASKTRFEQTAAFSVKHLQTGKCFHPLNGSIRPSVGTYVVIYTGCDQNRLQFKFIYG